MADAVLTKIAEIAVNQQAEAAEVVALQTMRHAQHDDLSTRFFSSLVALLPSLHYAHLVRRPLFRSSPTRGYASREKK
jgi:hypothetical protein